MHTNISIYDYTRRTHARTQFPEHASSFSNLNPEASPTILEPLPSIVVGDGGDGDGDEDEEGGDGVGDLNVVSLHDGLDEHEL